MEVSSSKDDQSFQPFEVKLKFESADEAARFWAIFNHTRIVDNSVGDDTAGKIRDAIVANCESVREKYGKYHSLLCKSL